MVSTISNCTNIHIQIVNLHMYVASKKKERKSSNIIKENLDLSGRFGTIYCTVLLQCIPMLRVPSINRLNKPSTLIGVLGNNSQFCHY